MTTPDDNARYEDAGYVLQVGDRVEASIGKIFRRVDRVTRVTKTMAVCETAGQQPVRYPRTYGFWFGALPYSSRTNMQYRVLKGKA